MNRTHTSHFVGVSQHSFNVIGSSSRCCAHVIACVICMVLSLSFDTLPLCTLHRLSHLPPHSPDLYLELPCGLVRGETPCALPRMRSSLTPLSTAPLTGYEPNELDNYHISETSEFFIQESSSDSRPLNSHDLDIDDHTIGKALSSPLFTLEREEPAGRRQAYHSLEESLLSSQSLSVGNGRTVRLVNELSSIP